MRRAVSSETRKCPGERYEIALPICKARQRNHYPKCLLCRYQAEDESRTQDSDPNVPASIFQSCAVLGAVPDEMNEYVARKVGVGAAQFLRAQSWGASGLVVAYDMRESSRGLCRAFAEGVNQGGLDTVSLGITAPEVLSFELRTAHYAGSAYVSGAAGAPEVSGIRLTRGDGTPLGFKNGLDKIGLIARRLKTGRSRTEGEHGFLDPRSRYRAAVLKFASGFNRLRIALDAGGGVAADLMPYVFEDQGISIIGLHFKSDAAVRLLGRGFPHPEVVQLMKEQIPAGGAVLGAAVDCTGERIAFFDENGDPVRHDAAAALVAGELLRESPSGTIAVDPRASDALREAITAGGGETAAFPTEDLAFRLAVRKNAPLYAADLSGRHFFRDFGDSSSPVTALLIVCSAAGREEVSLASFSADFNRYHSSGQVTISTPSAEVAQAVLDSLKNAFTGAERSFLDGLTVRTDGWWFHVCQPPEGSSELHLSLEARTAGELRRGQREVMQLIKRAQAAAAG